MVRSSGFGSTLKNYIALLTLAFAAAPVLHTLTSLPSVTRRPVLQKVRGHAALRRNASSACKHMVSGSFSLPSRGTFHLSLTVLYSIGHQVVFSLRRWSSCLPTEFLVLDGTLDSCFRTRAFAYRAFTLFRYSFQSYSTSICAWNFASPNPIHISIYGLGSYPFARHYLGNRWFTFFSSGY